MTSETSELKACGCKSEWSSDKCYVTICGAHMNEIAKLTASSVAGKFNEIAPFVPPAASANDERIVRDFLTNPDWGKYKYMEGSEIYAERANALKAFNRIMGRGK